MNRTFIKAAALPVRLFMKKPEITGTENIEAGVPAIFISNHLGHYAPLKLYVFTDYNYSPWVIQEVTDKKLCKDYLVKDFVEPVLHLRRPFSGFIAGLISPVCVWIMRAIGAIPVYRTGKKIMLTIEQSVAKLEQGGSLLIFPESKDEKFNEYINKFLTGFVNVAKIFFERNNTTVNFYPVCVDKFTNHITFGGKITFHPQNPFAAEKQRIVNELMKNITEMYSANK